jgi:hypothetical protein
MHAGVALLHTAVVALAQQFTGTSKHSRSNGKPTLGQTKLCLLDSHVKHAFA